MKRIYFFLLLFLFFSCSKDVQKDQEPLNVDIEQVRFIKDYNEIKISKVLRVGFMNTPTDYFIYKGKTMGFEYDLLNRFAKENQLDLEIILLNSIEEAFDSLNDGVIDIIGAGLTVLKERKEKVAFSESLYETHQILIQQRPENWKRMNPHTLEKKMLRDVIDLDGKRIKVRHASSFLERLQNLENEIGGDIKIIEANDSVSTSMLIEAVSDGHIKYTVSDLTLGKIGQLYYDNIDINTALSLNQKVAFSIRKNSPKLLKQINQFVSKSHNSGLINILYKRYYENERVIEKRLKSPYLLIENRKISPYDEQIKKYAFSIGWDWRLLAALIFKESKFDANASSWVGAKGLMQLMPNTALANDVVDVFNPDQNIRGGVKYLMWLENLWDEKLQNKHDLKQFVLASYNVGQGHVFDAQRLALKYGKNNENWDDVSYFLLKKSNPKYYKDEVVRHGYCRGVEPVDYVTKIFQTYDRYRSMIQ